MFERSFILVALALLIGGGWLLLRLWQGQRVANLRDKPVALPADIAARLSAGRVAVLSFSTPLCAECRTRQAPALKRLNSMLGEQIQIVALSALDQPELVAQFGILTVPATVVLDQTRQVRHINLGYASEQRLGQQVEAVRG